MRSSVLMLAVVSVVGVAGSARADIATFYFAPVGLTFEYYMPPDSFLVGGQVTSARVNLSVEVFTPTGTEGEEPSDAALFDAGIGFPVVASEDLFTFFHINGADVGWSGTGVFNYTLETTDFNGTFVESLFFAETLPLNAQILEGSMIELEYTPVPEPTLAGSLVVPAAAAMLRRRRR